MKWEAFFGVLSFLLVAGLLFFYEFNPLVNDVFEMKTPEESNFNIGVYNPDNMQFYPNLRFSEDKISYRISPACSVQKISDMKEAFKIVENATPLTFYQSEKNPEILISCKEKAIIDEGGFFIAGEGGATKIIQTEKFNVIFNGEILLLRDQECEKPNVAIHELFHVLGFRHSENPGSIMYNISRCNQIISEDIIRRLNELYSVESKPDISIDNASAFSHGRYLDVNVSVTNNGLADSRNTKIKIYTNDVFLKEADIGNLKIGYGKTFSSKNLLPSERDIHSIKIIAEDSMGELDLNDNEIILNIKK